MNKEKYNKWYNACEFIRTNLKFFSYQDFYERCFQIKDRYEMLDNTDKQLYKWYFMARIGIDKARLCNMWDWLNGYTTELPSEEEIQRRKNEYRNTLRAKN